MVELLVVAVLILFNGYFAMSEMAVVTARRSRLRQMATSRRGARAALDLAQAPERFLSTVQIGITLIAILMGAFGGEAFGYRIALWIEDVLPALAPWAVAIGLGLAVASITFATLIFGELVPKRFALTRAEGIASAVALPMRALASFAAPAVWLLSVCTRGVLRLLGVREDLAGRVSEEEIRLLVAEGHEQGVIDADERDMMNRVLALGDRTAASLMTPRRRITWLDAAASEADNLAVMRATPHARYPVCRHSDAEVLGVLEVKKLAGRIGRDRLELFRELQTPLFVPESTRAMRLLEILRSERSAMALVVDEYGDIRGLVTLNDLLAAVLGRIAPRLDPAQATGPAVRRADGSLLVDASLPVQELHALLGLMRLPLQGERDYHTLSGLCMARFGRIPQVGEYFDFEGWRFEVVDLDGTRIDKLLLQPVPSFGDEGGVQPGA